MTPVSVLMLLALPLGLLANYEKPMSRLNFFDIDLLRYCAEDRKGNVMVSPASIKATLAMVLEGAHGNTESEIRNALRLSPKKGEFREQLNLFLQGLKSNVSGVVIQNANSIFVSNKFTLNKDYEVQLKNVYLSEVFKVNFSRPEYSLKLINGWVANKTNGLIPSIVDASNVEPSTQILLTNALYFKGLWQHSFDATLTSSRCFYDHGECKKVAMMDLRGMLNYAYIDELRAHALELPYQGERYSMILLVPLDRDGCAPLIRDLPYKNIDQVIALLEPSDVQLSFPKFVIDYSEDMVNPLKNMRVMDLFTSSSNLSGIFESESPYISNMFHKVHMSVDEQGTEAAAATAAMVVPLIENGVTLRVDRPFVFFIRDNALGVVLFAGRIEDPTPFVVKEGDVPAPAPPAKEKPKEEPKLQTKPQAAH
ncbi:hypothetical protein ACJJTC_017113 [Scirpophaga incertulas]